MSWDSHGLMNEIMLYKVNHQMHTLLVTDDSVLLAPTAYTLQTLLNIGEQYPPFLKCENITTERSNICFKNIVA